MNQVGASVALTGTHLRHNNAGLAQDDATALLIRDGIITMLGSDAGILSAANGQRIRVIDVAGATVTPGLFDSHTHPEWAASITAGVDLGGIQTIDKLQAVLRKEASRSSEHGWVRGWNLEYEVFHETGITRTVIEEAVGGRPAILLFYDLHTGLATEAALKATGITGSMDFADTSKVVVDHEGVPTGELREMTAFRMVMDSNPPYQPEEEAEALRQMLTQFSAAGLTGGAIMDGNARTRQLLAELEERGQLTQRVTVHHWHAVNFSDEDMGEIIAAKAERGRLWQGGAIKLFSDGVIDTGTALLHHPDACGESQAAFWPDWDRLKEVVRAYHGAGMHIATHAVGDGAVSQMLDVYAELPPPAEGQPPHAIEHLEVLSDADIVKLGSSGVTASMQPLHMQWRAEDGSDNWTTRLGEDRHHSGYRTRSVLQSGARLVLGSDWPVASYDPRVGMAWARHRGSPDDATAPVFEPDQRLTAEEALLAYTLWPAQARGHDDRGHLSVGAVGDLTVWAEDPVQVTDAELPSLPIRYTIVDGGVVYEAAASRA